VYDHSSLLTQFYWLNTCWWN